MHVRPSVRPSVRRLSVYQYFINFILTSRKHVKAIFTLVLFLLAQKKGYSRDRIPALIKKNPKKQRTKRESLSQTQSKNIIIMNRLSLKNQGYYMYMQNLIVIHCSVQDFIFIDSVKSMLCQKMMFVYFQSYLILTATKTSFKTHFIKSSDLKF